MRDDFCAFIVTYGRPDNVKTLRALKGSGYTGKVFLVVDDADKTLPDYQARYPDQVLVFSRDDIATRSRGSFRQEVGRYVGSGEFDVGDNLGTRGKPAAVFARNALWGLAREVGCQFFVELDDDYSNFSFRLTGANTGEHHGWTIRSLDRVFTAMVNFIERTGCATLAMSQGGDHMGVAGEVQLRHRDYRKGQARKAMNSFVCDVRHPWEFRGRMNEDVNSYVSLGNVGELFFTYFGLQLVQGITQQHPGGLTPLYLDSGTYWKSFYTVLWAPSCVRITMGGAMRRPHHQINWNAAVPKIVHERHRRT